MDIEKRIDDDEGLMKMMIEIILLAMSGAMVEIDDANGILESEVMIVVITEFSHVIEIGTDTKTDTTIGNGC